MRIALPVTDETSPTNVYQSFGRAPFFLIYDTESREEHLLENRAVDSPGGAGVVASQTIVDSGVEAVLTPRCGQNSAQVLQEGGIALYQTRGRSVHQNIDAFLDGQLPSLGTIHPGFHRRGGN